MNSCTVEGCGVNIHARKWCRSHYERWRRTGSPSFTQRPLSSCKEPSCDGEHYGLGWCSLHYQRAKARKSDDVSDMIPLERTCAVDGCQRGHYGRGWCSTHYERWRNTGSTELAPRQVRHCSVEGCALGYEAKGFCHIHYARWKRNGDPGPVGALRTPGDWVANDGYVMRYIPALKSPVAVHRLVMAESVGRSLYPDETVHHKNGDRSDNRLANLELWSSAQPSGQRVEDKITFALEILGRYKPDALRVPGG